MTLYNEYKNILMKYELMGYDEAMLFRFIKRIALIAFWLFIGLELGFLLFMLGLFLSITIILSFIGVPLLRWGISLMNPLTYLYL